MLSVFQSAIKSIRAAAQVSWSEPHVHSFQSSCFTLAALLHLILQTLPNPGLTQTYKNNNNNEKKRVHFLMLYSDEMKHLNNKK